MKLSADAECLSSGWVCSDPSNGRRRMRVHWKPFSSFVWADLAETGPHSSGTGSAGDMEFTDASNSGLNQEACAHTETEARCMPTQKKGSEALTAMSCRRTLP